MVSQKAPKRHLGPPQTKTRKIEGPGLPGASINYQGHLFSTKRTPMIGIPAKHGKPKVCMATGAAASEGRLGQG